MSRHLDLNLNPIVGAVTRYSCDNLKRALKKKSILKKMYPKCEYAVEKDSNGYFVKRIK